MDSRNLRLVQESLDRLRDNGSLAKSFARELEQLAADEMSLDRQRDLVDIVVAAVPSLCDASPNPAEPSFSGAVDPHDFEYASNALLRTLKAFLGQEFSYDLWQAWIEALHTLARTLTMTPMPAGSRSV